MGTKQRDKINSERIFSSIMFDLTLALTVYACNSKGKFKQEFKNICTLMLSIRLRRMFRIGYDMWQKNNVIDFLFTKVFFFKHQCYPLQNCSLGDIVPTFGSRSGSMVWYGLVNYLLSDDINYIQIKI